MIRRILPLAGLCLLAVIALVTPSARAQYFTITDYHADMTVHTDGATDVVETIRVTFDQPRHGIYRDIPVRYVTDNGDHYETPLNVVSVTDDHGTPYEYETGRSGSVMRVKIGSASTYVDGDRVYVIRYRVQRVVTFFRDHDELYWNVTGNGWQAPIDAASATITLETDRTVHNPRGACYTGRYGSRERACNYSIDGSTATFECTRPLDVGEGFTVVFGFDRGLIAEPTAWQKFWWAIDLGNNWGLLIPLVAFFWMFSAWWQRGRDPKIGESIAVQYEPPKVDGRSMSAAEMGVLIDETLDQRDLSGAIIGLASQGYIKIQEGEKEGLVSTSTDYQFIKVKESDNGLTAFERNLMTDLFDPGLDEVKTSELSGKFYANLPGLRKALFTGLTNLKLFARNPLNVRSKYLGVGFTLGIATAIVTTFTATSVPIVGLVSAVATAAIIIGIGNAMPARTRQGVHVRNLILGFQEFMTRADKDRLERMGADLFYKYLPYAVSLGVTKQWANAFSGLSLEPPSWYVPLQGYTMFNTMAFVHQIDAGTAQIGNATFSAPRGSGLSGGSGGGGGGFSGGGGGGGGGGSW